MVTRPDPAKQAKQYARRTPPATGEPSMASAFRATEGEKTRHIGARVSTTFHKELSIFLVQQDLSMQDFLTSAVVHEMQRLRGE